MDVENKKLVIQLGMANAVANELTSKLAEAQVALEKLVAENAELTKLIEAPKITQDVTLPCVAQ